MASNFKKKPTIKELANVIIELNSRINGVMNLLSELEKAFSLYIEMNKDSEKFSKFIDKKLKEYKEMANDSDRNGKADKQDIHKDTENKGSRPEGVRKKAK